MSLIQGNTKVAAAGGYSIDQSIRFNDDDSAYLSRTPASAGNRKTWTWSGWVKRGNLGSYQILFAGGDASSNNDAWLRFGAVSGNIDALEFRSLTGGSYTANVYTSAIFRDPSAWYHVVFSADTTQATSTDRIKIYVNGQQQTVTFGTTPAQNSDMSINIAGLHTIGRLNYSAANYFDGYLSEINFIDGQALSPTDFGETNDDGVWIPKKYAGTYGTNGFYLKGQDSADLGNDSSGNGNNFSSSGLTASDQVPDSPTDSYCVMNPLTGVNAGSSVVTQANGNLEATMTANYVGTFGTLAANSGKYYFEYSYAADANYNDGRLFGGVVCVETADHSYFRIDGGSFYRPDKVTEGNYMIKHLNGSGEQSNTGTSTSAYNTNLSSASATGGPESGPDIYMVAMDLDNNNLYWGKNGTWYGASSTSGSDYTDATPIAILAAHQGKYFAPAFGFYGATSGTTGVLNCGQDATFGGRYSSPAGDFYYTPPTGFSKLSTSGLAAPTIADGSAYFQTTLYSGNGSTQEINQSGNSTFQPSWVWIKERNGTRVHSVYDEVRGVEKYLQTAATDAESTSSLSLTSFDADGFTLGSGPWVNNSGNTYVAWQWLAANGTASNTNGSITSTVSANTTAGFSIVSWTLGSTDNQTVGHGLSSAPEFMFLKNRSAAGGWTTYHKDNTSAPETEYLRLDSSNATVDSALPWNDTAPTSSVFTIGDVSWFGSASDEMIMHCFRSIPGFSKLGSYTGNGSSDGPFVWCGFRPAVVFTKRTNSTGGVWLVLDSTRSEYNQTSAYLQPHLNSAEVSAGSTIHFDFLSNGFKLRCAPSGLNASGDQIIFAAFAEHPFGGSGVAPVPAR